MTKRAKVHRDEITKGLKAALPKVKETIGGIQTVIFSAYKKVGSNAPDRGLRRSLV